MNHVLFLMLIFISFGCGRSPGEKDVSDIKTFKLQGISLESQRNTSVSNSFPRFEKAYDFAVDVVDISTNIPISNTKFVIDLADEGRLNVVTDKNGTLRWSEKLAYYLTNEKKQIFLKRKVSSYDKRKNSQEISFYLYPYESHLSDGVSEFSLTPSNGSERLELDDKIEASRMGDSITALELKNAKIEFAYLGIQGEGAKTRVEIEGEIFAEIFKYNNEIYDYILNSGDFLVYMELTDSKKNVFYRREAIEAKLINKKLNINFVDNIKYNKQFEDVYLNIRVAPLSLGSRFSVFQGRHKLGMFNNLFDKHDLSFAPENNSRFSDFSFPIQHTVLLSDNQEHTLRFDKLTLEYDMIEDGETPTTRTIIYRSKTCVSDYYQDKKLSFEEFSISKTTGEVVIRRADSDGCLYWNESIKFKYYRPENFFKRKNIITHIKSDIKKEMTSYVNPWTILTIGRDEIEMDTATLEKINDRTDVYSRLFLEEYSFETIGVTYHLDEYMTLFVRKNILLDLEFEVTRYSSLTDGINAKEDIRDGVYLLKVAIEKSYIDTRKTFVEIEQTLDSTIVKNSMVRKPIEYIYVVSKLVRVWNGHIITPVELSIHDLRLMTVRSNFLVQIQPIDQDLLTLNKNFDIKDISTDRVVSIIKEKFPNQEPRLELLAEKNSGLPTRTFTGPMILLEMEGGADVRPTDAINVCHTDDCNFLEKDNDDLTKRKFTHDQKYFGSIKHLINKTVDMLQEEKKVLDLKYENQMRVESSLYNYLETFKLKFVADDDRDIYYLPNSKGRYRCESANVKDCFTLNNSRRMKASDFLSLINDNNKLETITSVGDILRLPVESLQPLGINLCFKLVRDKKFKIKKYAYSKTHSIIRENALWNKLNTLCEHVESYSFNNLIKTEGVKDFSFLGGKTINFDLGSANSVDYSEEFNTGVEISAEINPLGLFGDTVSSIIGTGVSLSGASETSYSYGDSSGLTSNTYLAMQRATFDIKFKNPLYCMEIRILPKFLRKLKEVQSVFDHFVVDISAFEEGYLLCDTNVSQLKYDHVYRERFYYFAQHFTEGHMLDDGSILNHPWLLGLRGERDYTVFVHLLGLKPLTSTRSTGAITKFFQKASGWYLDSEDSLLQSFNQNNLAELPLDQISNAFENVLPSFPGIYNLTGEKKEYPYD